MRRSLLATGVMITTSCNFALGLGGYEFDASGGRATTSQTSSTTSRTESQSNQGGRGGMSTTSADGGSGGATSVSTSSQGGQGGQGGQTVDGSVLWSLPIGTQEVSVTSAALDGQSHVYVAGSYKTADANPVSGCAPLPGTSSITKGFVIELSAQGECKHALSFGAAGKTEVTALAVSATGAITLAIAYDAPLGVPGAPALPPPVGVDAVVVRYPSTVNLDMPSSATWARRIGDAGDQRITDLALDATNDVWITGHYTSSLVIVGPSPLVKVGVPQRTGFVARLADTDGSPSPNAYRLFAGTAPADVEALAVAVKKNDDIAVAGRASAYAGVDFGEGPETHKGGQDGFFARYSTPSMAFLGGAWLSDGNDQIARDVAYTGGGDLYVTGLAYGNLDFHNGVTLALPAQRAFLAHVAPDGTSQKAISIGDVDVPANLRCAALPNGGGVVFAGMMHGAISLPGMPPPSATTMGNDIVVGRLDTKLANGAWLHVYGDGYEQGADALAVGPHGEIVIAGHFQNAFPFGGMTFPGVAMFVAQIKP